jgi:hypothetical protein
VKTEVDVDEVAVRRPTQICLIGIFLIEKRVFGPSRSS